MPESDGFGQFDGELTEPSAGEVADVTDVAPVSEEVAAQARQRRRWRTWLSQIGGVSGRLGFMLGDVHDEPTYLTYQRELREGGSFVLNEAMLVLDIIDSKTQSLLAYISVSVAALIFLITALPDSQADLDLGLLSRSTTITILLVVIFALMVAVVFCLSCLNIVGAHTIGDLKRRQRQSQEEYENLVVQVTCGRRNRYLIAHRISMVTAVGAGLVFLDLLVGSVV